MTARIRAAAAEALVVAALVGVVEALVVGRSHVMVAALAVTGWSVLAVVGRAVLGLILRVEPIASWRADLAGAATSLSQDAPLAGGLRRRIVLGGLAALAFGVIAFRVVASIHVAYRFRDAGPVALLVMGLLVPVALVILIVALLVDRRAARSSPATGSPARAVWRALLVAGAITLFGAVGFRAVAWIHVAYRFDAAEPVAALTVGVLVPLGLVVLGGARVLDRRVAPRMATVDLAGRRGTLVAVIAAGLGVVLPMVVVAVAIPAIELGAVGCAALLVVGLVVARATRLGARRFAPVAAIVLLALAVSASLLMGHAPAARAAAIEQGIASTRVVRRLLAVSDRDGDGYAGHFGGADCDDADATRHPAAVELAGNGIDENCTGADAPPPAIREAVSPPRGAVRPDILLISIDALRADHLSAWGYDRPTSPTIDALAAAGTRFAWAVTPSPTTRHALPALLDGRYASLAHRDDRPGSLAEVLQAAGYATGAVLCGDRLVIADALRGFQDVDRTAEAARAASPGLDNAGAVVDAALRWWGPRRAPAFLWVHLYEPHHPYVAPPGSPDFGDDDLDRYDAEIAAVDRELARLLAAVDPARTIIVLAADHGEEFGEHGIRFHARSLYNQVIRVPLVVRAPDSRPQVVDSVASLVDVMPTVLELAGVAAPPGLSGRSLAGLVRGGPGAESDAARAVLLELPPDRQITRDLVGAIAGPWKVIWDREANAWSLFGRDDVLDAHDQATARPEALAAMQRTLFDLLDRELAAAR